MGKKQIRKDTRFFNHWRIVSLGLIIYDAIAVNVAYFAALLLRFDFSYASVEPQMVQAYFHYVPVSTIVSILIFSLFHLYKSIWKFAGIHELLRAFFACLLSGIIHTFGISLLFTRMPIAYYFFGFVIQFILVGGLRFSYRIFLLERSRLQSSDALEGRVMIIGAGEAGRALYRDIETSRKTDLNVICFIDDDPNKWGRYIEKVPIVGSRDDILKTVKDKKIDKIMIAVPSASVEQRRDLANICKESGCEVKILPGNISMIQGDNVSVAQMRDVNVEDLLGRDEIKADMTEIFNQISDKVILVTGGGGSIGSELCRQIAAHGPKRLVIFDVYENNAYDIQNELRKKYPYLNLTVLIGSVRDSRKIEDVFRKYRPDITFHAAAHKHVPLMEDSPQEAIKNNVFGTYKTAYAAIKYHCPKFVLISTDKAVNPTNIMGASKRVCEMVVQTLDHFIKNGQVSKIPHFFTHYDDGAHDETELPEDACTEFVAVRFGNVLGSNGSVIPLFKRQIAEGGPVTVTHPDIIRYFMTIPEAVSLVLQASVYAKGGEIFVLDMGEPVKIDTLARNLIKLSGFTPDQDIQIVYTGLRPGEKLYEEKLMAEEGLTSTPNKLIFIGKPVEFDKDWFVERLETLLDGVYSEESETREVVREIIKAGGAKEVG